MSIIIVIIIIIIIIKAIVNNGNANIWPTFLVATSGLSCKKM